MMIVNIRAAGNLLLCISTLSLFASCKFGEKESRASEKREGATLQDHASHAGYVTADSASADSVSPFKSPQDYLAHFEGYRTTWTRLTGDEYSGLHWGQIIRLYVNKNPDTYIKNYLEYLRLYVNTDIDEVPSESKKKFEPYAIGTIFLKENYLSKAGKRTTPISVTAMIKRQKGYDPAANDWEFVQFDAKGNVLLHGKSSDKATMAMCIKCHANISERDFVFSTFCSLVPAQ